MSPPPVVRVLSFHAGYACRHSGRCCTSNWPITIPPDAAERVRQAVNPCRFDHSPDGEILLGRTDGRCVFHDSGCRIQRSLGHKAIPLECRQFPRQSLTDLRGTSVTLSHYCPTARTQLETADGTVTILEDAPGFPSTGEYVGLEATTGFPPLLHPRCLLDWESWWTIERLAVTLVSEGPETAVPRLATVVEQLHTWRPAGGPLFDRVRRAFDDATAARLPRWHPSDALVSAHIADARAAVPVEWHSEADEALGKRGVPLAWPVFGRFLAAHTFANWAAYRGQGLRTWHRSIEAAGCLAWVTGDPGSADLVLRHLADSSTLVARWSQAEATPATRRP